MSQLPSFTAMGEGCYEVVMKDEHGSIMCMGFCPCPWCLIFQGDCTRNSPFKTVISEGDKMSSSLWRNWTEVLQELQNYKITDAIFCVNVGSQEGVSWTKSLQQWPGRELLAGQNQLPAVSAAIEKGKCSSGQEIQHAREERVQEGTCRWQREQGHKDLCKDRKSPIKERLLWGFGNILKERSTRVQGSQT